MLISHTPKGGGNEVPASCHDYLIDEELIRIDCGMRPTGFSKDDIFPVKIRNSALREFLDNQIVAPDFNPLPNWDSIPRIKNIFLTHGHFDHVGGVPYILRKYRDATIFATQVTLELCKLQWFSTPWIAKINKEEPLFNEDDASFALSRVKAIHPGERIRINSRLEIEPVPAGHLLGAVSYVFYYDGVPVGMHTGDFTLNNRQRSVPDAPEIRFDRLRFLTAESTRITEKSSDRKSVEEEFGRTLRSAYERGIKTYILGFAIGRIQELYILAKQYCPEAEIYIDGLGRNVSSIYAEHGGDIFAGIEQHYVLDNGKGARFGHRDEIKHSDQPVIVFVPSAMRFGGKARKYIEYGCSKSNHLFISPGYRDPRSPEYAFFESETGDIFRFGQYDYPKRCETAKFNFSSHCTGDDVLELMRRVNPDKTILIHGDNNKMDEFVKNNPGKNIFKSVNGVRIEL